MQTPPETEALLADLFERSAIVAELDGPQIEAWVSGLFPLFEDGASGKAFVAYCRERPSIASALVCAAIAELADGTDEPLGASARQALGDIVVEDPPVLKQIGTSSLQGAWSVRAPFGQSIVLGFDVAAIEQPSDDPGDDEPVDHRHSILVEVGDDGTVEDLQLAGAAQTLLDEASASDERVQVRELDVADAIETIASSWPTESATARTLGPGVGSNQQFVRRRFARLGTTLPAIAVEPVAVDIRRGLDDREFDEANRAARSTLQAALGLGDDDAADDTDTHRAWIGVIRGDGGELTRRERDALLWLEWADWLGAGIGLHRAAAGAAADPESLVDYVNRCPEVSSSIDKADREYAAWAFGVALELLEDVGAVADGKLTETGYAALGPAMAAAWR